MEEEDEVSCLAGVKHNLSVNYWPFESHLNAPETLDEFNTPDLFISQLIFT